MYFYLKKFDFSKFKEKWEENIENWIENNRLKKKQIEKKNQIFKNKIESSKVDQRKFQKPELQKNQVNHTSNSDTRAKREHSEKLFKMYFDT